MDMNELLALRARFLEAKVHKHSIGSAASYAAALEKECGPADFDGEPHTTAHLLALVDKAIRVHGAPKAAPKKVESTAKVEIKTVEPKATKSSK